jgi:taurine transport system ATP-binding protein
LGLTVQNISMRFDVPGGAVQALKDVSVELAKGELLSVLGPSGCGKTTLLNILAGFLTPTEGRVTLNGHAVTGPHPERGMVFQQGALFEWMSVRRNVDFGPRMKGMAAAERNRITDHLLDTVGLAEFREKAVYELSGGMQQRVAIAQALMAKPRVLMMDEPFGALDPETREAMQVLILQLWEQDQMTVFFVTHDMEEALYLGTRILVLSQHYTDDRGPGSRRGARIVADFQLEHRAQSTEVKRSSEFLDRVAEIRRVGFDPRSLRHVDEFNLRHPDSFRTLHPDESKATV